ncbi:MAG: hypothetical protein AAB513_03700 [Patescibacteria group bacterium]
MDSKKIIWIGMFVGSGIGGYLPVFSGGCSRFLSRVNKGINSA